MRTIVSLNLNHLRDTDGVRLKGQLYKSHRKHDWFLFIEILHINRNQPDGRFISDNEKKIGKYFEVYDEYVSKITKLCFFVAKQPQLAKFFKFQLFFTTQSIWHCFISAKQLTNISKAVDGRYPLKSLVEIHGIRFTCEGMYTAIDSSLNEPNSEVRHFQ